MPELNPRGALAGIRAEVDRMVTSDGYTPVDLVDAGASVYLAREYARRDCSVTFEPSSPAIQIPVPADTDLVALVASGHLAREFLGIGAYVRDRGLRQPVRRIAGYIGTDHHRVVDEVRPILARWILADNSVTADDLPLPVHLDDGTRRTTREHARRVLEHPDFADNWHGPLELFLLDGPELDIHVPLGFRGKGGIPGTRHVRLADLQLASRTFACNGSLSDGPDVIDSLASIPADAPFTGRRNHGTSGATATQ